MSRNIKFSKYARNSMVDGIEVLYNATRVTLGPKGRNVIIEQDFGSPLIVNDGVTIAKSIELADQFENMGSSLIIESATKTNDLVGDGTTTAIILSCNLIFEGLKQVDKGISPVSIRMALNEALEHLLKFIDERSLPVKDLSDLEKIAYISSGSDVVSKVLKEAYQEVGTFGIISIEESRTSETYLELNKGYLYERGYLSPYMINNTEKGLTELVDPYILIIDHKINTMNELVPYFEKVISENKPLLIICEDIDNEVLNTIVLNKLRGVFNCVVTKAPYYGDKARKTLEDLAIITGSVIAGEDFILGTAEKVIIKKDTTTIINGKGDENRIAQRIKELEELKKNETSTYELEQLNSRISKVKGVAAVIKVGSSTETALQELRLRTEDALNATRAASLSGVIEGGGKVFYELALALNNLPISDIVKPILEKTLKQPFFQIIENAGMEKELILKNVNEKIWYDASDNTYVSLFDKGVIDPATVAKTALESAISIAGIFLTTECAIVKNKDEKKEDNELI